MLFNFDFKGLKRGNTPLFLSSLLIAIIDIFHKVSKNILDNNEKKLFIVFLV
jgi:hypothetical protein